MKDKELQNKMNAEINKRLESPEWDARMADRIMSGVLQKKKKRYIAASISSMAAAAVIIIALFFNTGVKTAGEYEQLIQNQLDGIYIEVFNEKYVSRYSSVNEDVLLYDNIDILIDNTLSKR